MQENIFDISFEYEGKQYKGWVNPSDKLNGEGRPASFHVVLNDTSFGYLAYNSGKWTINEERPQGLVSIVGKQIGAQYGFDTTEDLPLKSNKQYGGVTEKHDKNAGSGAFNQGSEQDEHLNEGVADGTADPDQVSKEKQNPRSGRPG